MEALDLLSTAASTAATVAGGGVFGLIGSIGSAIFKSKAKKAEQAYALEAQDRELVLAESDHYHKIVETRQQMSASGLTASINADVVTNLPAWAAGAKALFRPFLTTTLILVCMYIFTLLLGALSGENVLGEVFAKQEIVAMIRYTVYSLVFSTATSITWWFGDRALSPPGNK